MSEPKKKQSAMLPLIIVGATLFAFGTYQSTRPKEPEVNSGFVAPPENPRTMQAPDAPTVDKDAAQRAAETADITRSSAETASSASAAKSILDEAWFAALKADSNEMFRPRVLDALALQQLGKSINCTPSLSGMSDGAKAALEEIACTATDGTTFEANFDAINDGAITAVAPNKTEIRIRKVEGAFSVTTETADQ